jgi:aryl-alcohol dehydrogenase-like predicted oxidoreductase
MALKGSASIDSTKKSSKENKKLKYNALGKTGLLTTDVGFGSYRVDIRSKVNKEALKKAILSGINLIDTSSTYTNGNAELLIGEVLAELSIAEKLSRESIVIVTKGGYIQGFNYELSKSRKKENNSFPDLVEYQNGLEHCIHPEFLKDQITRSLERLELETIDVYLLHNPEYYLKWAKNNAVDLSKARKEYYSRIKTAFEYLEKEVEKGRINHYGISSNTFPLDADNYEFTCLNTVIKIAEEIYKNNHFSVIEFPMNFAESNAYTISNQPNNITLLELAEKKNLGVLINRPLNAIYNNHLITLAEPFIDDIPNAYQINAGLKHLIDWKKLLSEQLESAIEGKFIKILEESLFIFEELQDNWLEITYLSNWQGALNQYFLPRIYYSRNFINKSSLNNELQAELFDFTDNLLNLFNLITSYYNGKHLELTQNIKKNIADSIPELSSTKHLSNMAIRALRSTKGINTVLVGMTQSEYVIDVLDELRIPTAKDFDWNKINFKHIIENLF